MIWEHNGTYYVLVSGGSNKCLSGCWLLTVKKSNRSRFLLMRVNQLSWDQAMIDFCDPWTNLIVWGECYRTSMVIKKKKKNLGNSWKIWTLFQDPKKLWSSVKLRNWHGNSLFGPGKWWKSHNRINSLNHVGTLVLCPNMLDKLNKWSPMIKYCLLKTYEH